MSIPIVPIGAAILVIWWVYITYKAEKENKDLIENTIEGKHDPEKRTK